MAVSSNDDRSHDHAATDAAPTAVRGLPPFLLGNPRLCLFGGKGGVGKSTCAAAAALALARQGQGVLLISIDPAHSLRDLLTLQEDASDPGNPGPEIPILEDLGIELRQLDAEHSLQRFRQEVGEPVREILHRGTLLAEEETLALGELALPGIDELMAFLEIGRELQRDARRTVVVDLPPTGHSLRFLAVAGLLRVWLRALDALLDKPRYLERAFGGGKVSQRLGSFLLQLDQEVRALEQILRSPESCRFCVVCLPETGVAEESARLIAHLESRQITPAALLVNRRRRTGQHLPGCVWSAPEREAHLQTLAGSLAADRQWCLPDFADQGLDPPLRDLWQTLEPWPGVAHDELEVELVPDRAEAGSYQVASPLQVFDESRRIAILAGKGGVGKSTLAAAIAAHLSKARPVLLVSSDPAHSLADVLGLEVGGDGVAVSDSLRALEIDAEAEMELLRKVYGEEVASWLGQPQEGLALRFEDRALEHLIELAPPGLDEVMALTRLTDLLTEHPDHLLVLDPAPTGHLLRLLELPQIIDQWLRALFKILLQHQANRQLPRFSALLVRLSKGIKELMAVLGDAQRACAVGVATAEALALREAAAIQQRCAALGLSMPALLINLLHAIPGGSSRRSSDPPAKDLHESEVCPACARAGERELRCLQQAMIQVTGVQQTLVRRGPRPVGLSALQNLGAALFGEEPGRSAA